MRRVGGRLAFATLAVGLIAAAIARAAVASEPVHVRPAAGPATASFVVSFRESQATGVVGGVRRHDVVSGEAGRAHAGCVATFALGAPDAAAGAVIRVVLSPARLGGQLCPGTVHGRVLEERTPVCTPGEACPQFIVLLGVIGRFSFAVSPSAGAPDTTRRSS